MDLSTFAVAKVENNRTVLTTIGETDSLVDMHFNSVNLANEATAVYFDLELKSGKLIRVFASVNVSKGIRAKEISRENLLNFPLTQAVTKKDAIPYLRVEFPEGTGNGHRITFHVKDLKAQAYIPKEVDWEALIA